jgi:hypothetical protein
MRSSEWWIGARFQIDSLTLLAGSGIQSTEKVRDYEAKIIGPSKRFSQFLECLLYSKDGQEPDKVDIHMTIVRQSLLSRGVVTNV